MRNAGLEEACADAGKDAGGEEGNRMRWLDGIIDSMDMGLSRL